ncbi:ABC transporter substrate-binding protein [Cohnella thailandensis]|uniref:Iron-siderophore ABC transporter substrate-binding protein n=1 Tax=Cohnella thailandensis TaxID=557557 RepID=A0A841SWK0_9BACL|nr:iron-siderophore ABC transporter substrate-binding protein [Cohnella thailandensis]MBB6633111.1 iron-siderophore ABC transporter substrate-binding protein [Cohnella thailandensis]MBP1975194.1 iron complex transport system substrate-binding protein [Cohnella thailandensis]
MRSFKFTFVLAILAVVLVIAGCGNNNNSSDSAASPSASSSPSASAESTAPASESASPAADQERVIKHSLGETTIKGTPQRVVVLEWVYGEDLLALGLKPVGFADIEGYKQWAGDVEEKFPLGAEVVDVGTRQEPNLEAISALKPDLIIGVKFRVEQTYDQLSKIAPTVVYDPYPAEGQGDQYEEMETTFKSIADIVGKSAEAQTVLDNLHKTFEEAKAKVVAAGKENAPFVLSMDWSNQNAAQFRLFTDNSMASKIIEKIGLTNAFEPQQFEIYGYSTTDVEALPAVQDANFLHITQPDDDVIANILKDNAVWKSLTFVKENRVYALGGDLWPFGGPILAESIANTVSGIIAK